MSETRLIMSDQLNELNETNESIEELIIRKRLRERRLSLNLTYQDLSDKTNISKSSLQRYELMTLKPIYKKSFYFSNSIKCRSCLFHQHFKYIY